MRFYLSRQEIKFSVQDGRLKIFTKNFPLNFYEMLDYHNKKMIWEYNIKTVNKSIMISEHPKLYH